VKTEEILNEREKTHGDYKEFCELWSALNRAIREHTEEHPKSTLTSIYPERTIVHTTSICMILNKIARIMCGDPNHADHWDDIAGYAMLGKGEKNGVTSVSGKCGEIAEDRYAEGWNDGCDSAQAIYSKMKEENEQLKERNKQLELDVMRAHNKGVDAASEYYESIIDDFKNKWIDPEKALPAPLKRVEMLRDDKVIEHATCIRNNHIFGFEFRNEDESYVGTAFGWRYPQSTETIYKDKILLDSRLKDLEEIKSKHTTSSKMEHVNKYTLICCRNLGGCNRPMRLTSVAKDGKQNYHCDKCGNYVQLSFSVPRETITGGF
jgi:hypothetical protein